MSDRRQVGRDRYPFHAEIATRWMDCDAYGHVNNVQYLSYLDTAVTYMLREHGVIDGPHWKAIGLAIESHCNYHAPVCFPDVVDVCVRIGRVGTTSLRYEVGIFRKDDELPAATAHFVHVFVDPGSHRPVPLVEPVREAMLALMVEG